MKHPAVMIKDLVLKQLAAAKDPQQRAALLLEIMELNTTIAKEVKKDVDSFQLSTLGSGFDVIIEKTFELEGGWVNSNSDPGGATMYGISSRFHPEYAQKIKNKTLTLKEAKAIYKSEYWDTIYKVDAIPLVLAWIIFDARVHGSKESIIDMQNWMKVNTNPQITADGVFGKNSWSGIPANDKGIASLLAYLKKNTKISAKLAAMRVMNYQKNNGLEIEDYTKGFITRLEGRYSFAESLLA